MRSPSIASLLHDIADHIDAGDEFWEGRWSHHGEPTGLGASMLPGRRRAWVDGVRISRSVQADQLRRVADWEWTDEQASDSSGAGEPRG